MGRLQASRAPLDRAQTGKPNRLALAVPEALGPKLDARASSSCARGDGDSLQRFLRLHSGVVGHNIPLVSNAQTDTKMPTAAESNLP